MPILPDESLALLEPFAPVFTQPTYGRFLMPLGAAILTTGRRTVANLLRTAGSLAPGHPSSYRRVVSQARWSMTRLACALTRALVARLPGDAPVVLVGDDTVVARPGPHVYGKARHRDPVRSSHTYTAWRYGHRWVALAVLVRFPFADRPRALPVPVALYQSEEPDRSQGHRHRTPAQHIIRLLGLMLRWSPDRRFVFVGDSAYGSEQEWFFRDPALLRLPAADVEHRRRGLDRDEPQTREPLGAVEQFRPRACADAEDSRIGPRLREHGPDEQVQGLPRRAIFDHRWS